MRNFKDLREKKLTPAEKKKREEIAKAMERENPGMDMKKKMAIATWQAKKVAEATVHRDFTDKTTPMGNKKAYAAATANDVKKPVSLKKAPWDKKNEEVELDEVSDKKLDAYRQKAFADQPSGDDGSNKYRKRKFGRDLAFAKQTGRAKVLATKEEVEAIDEISKKTLGSYIKKAKDDLGNREAEVTRNRYVDPRGVKDPIKHNNALLMKRAKRRDNINKAVDKLTREQTEDDMPASPDELGMAMRQLDFIEDAAEKIKDRLGSGKGFPEWMQNKLSKLHGQMESLYSSLGELEDEDEVEMDEAVQSADRKPEKYIRPDGKVGIRMAKVDKKVIKND